MTGVRANNSSDDWIPKTLGVVPSWFHIPVGLLTEQYACVAKPAQHFALTAGYAASHGHPLFSYCLPCVVFYYFFQPSTALLLNAVKNRFYPTAPIYTSLSSFFFTIKYQPPPLLERKNLSALGFLHQKSKILLLARTRSIHSPPKMDHKIQATSARIQKAAEDLERR